jgi:hypothetical protein
VPVKTAAAAGKIGGIFLLTKPCHICLNQGLRFFSPISRRAQTLSGHLLLLPFFVTKIALEGTIYQQTSALFLQAINLQL